MYYRGAAAAVIVYDITSKDRVFSGSVRSEPVLLEIGMRKSRLFKQSMLLVWPVFFSSLFTSKIDKKTTETGDQKFMKNPGQKVDCQESLDAAKGWVTELKGTDTLIALAGNKVDLEASRVVEKEVRYRQP